MKYLLYIVFSFTVAVAQSNIDSILKKIANQPDTLKIKTLSDLCWDNRNKNTALAIRYGEEALKIARAIENLKLQAQAHNLIGVVYRNIGYYDKALENYTRALSLAERGRDSIQIAYSHNNIGGIYRLQMNYAIAFEHIMKSLKLFERLNNKEGIAFAMMNLGVLYWRQKNYTKAAEYFNQTARIREELGDKAGLAVTYNNLAEIYYDKKDFESAMNYYVKLEETYSGLGDMRGLAYVWGGMGGVYASRGDLKNAIIYRNKALALNRQINNYDGIIVNMNNLAILYAKMGNFAVGEKFLKAALELSEKRESPQWKLQCYQFAGNFYKQKRDFKKAYGYIEQYSSLKDSVIVKENIARFAEMESIYKVEKTERENAILHKDLELKERQRNYLILIAILVLFISLVIYSRYRSQKSANKELRELNEMKDTFFRIIAHDLKTPFNTIFGYTEYLKKEISSLSDSEKLDIIEDLGRTTRKTYELLDNLLIWSQSHTGKIEYKPVKINLCKEIENNFMLLEATARKKEISLNLNCPPDTVVMADENMLNAIFRNLISNAIKFTGQSGRVDVNVVEDDKFVEVTVADNGIGIEAEHLKHIFELEGYELTRGTEGEKGTGLGLIICKEFIERHGGKIRAESQPGKGSNFIFTLPKK